MRIFTITIIALMLSACTSMVSVDYNKNTDFNSFKTYYVKTAPERVTKDTRIDSPFMQQRVVSELNKSLANKGFKNLSKNYDLEVQYFLDIKQDIESRDSGFVSLGVGSISHHSSMGLGFAIPIGEAYSVDMLVLTIDLVSTKSKKLVWRGSLGYSLYVGSTPETYTKLINDLVIEILKEFPPK